MDDFFILPTASRFRKDSVLLLSGSHPMISVILYGRNDSHGYNLHKRAAISFNCIAEVLTEKNDEIIFVDYNTPDDYPTFPEAIADTLTEKAKNCIRILRVRPSIHNNLFHGKTHLNVIESISRNVALRRSNCKNKWILSSNSDMLFLPKKGKSLTAAVESLSEDFYCAPRFELPETLWESLNRLDPCENLSLVQKLGVDLNLNDIVLGSEYIRYDAPGDFQLVNRNLLFSISGFDERMLLGWHVDSNISRRLRMITNVVSDAEQFVHAYHCDHTRQMDILHSGNKPINDWSFFVENLESPYLPEQEASWGLVQYPIEELSLRNPVSDQYRRTLISVLPRASVASTVTSYTEDSFDCAPVTPAHIVPFLFDMLVNFRRDLRVAWIGEAGELSDLLAASIKSIGFSNPLTHLDMSSNPHESVDQADLFILNFGCPLPARRECDYSLGYLIWCSIQSELQRMKENKLKRRFIGVNCVHNRFEQFFSSFFHASKTPFSTRIRQGYVNAQNCDTIIDLKDNGVVSDDRLERDEITVIDDGLAFSSGIMFIPPGVYKLSFKASMPSSLQCTIIVELIINNLSRCQRFTQVRGEHSERHNFIFFIDEEDFVSGVCFRFFSFEGQGLIISCVALHRAMAYDSRG